jgi:hypothetical protein
MDRLSKAIAEFEKETPQEKPGKLGTVIEKVKQDNGYWLLIQFDGEKEPRWVHEGKLSKIEEQ